LLAGTHGPTPEKKPEGPKMLFPLLMRESVILFLPKNVVNFKNYVFGGNETHE
jgi:hypothetical protein